MIYSYYDVVPVISKQSYVHDSAVIIGRVQIEEGVYIGPGAVLRGDFGEIIVRKGSNIQENCVVHMFPGMQAIFEEASHIGHGAVIHGAHIGRNSLVGMNAVLMDQVKIGAGSIIGALSFVPANTEIPERSLVVGNPAKIVKNVSDKMLDWKTRGTTIYQHLTQKYSDHLRKCTPLEDQSEQKELPKESYPVWPSVKK